MSINLKDLVSLIKTLEVKVYRDQAPKNTPFPYVVYTYISTENVWSGSRVYRKLPLYQFSLFTVGTEKELTSLENLLSTNQVLFSDFSSIQFQENDKTVSNFYTQIRVVSDG